MSPVCRVVGCYRVHGYVVPYGFREREKVIIFVSAKGVYSGETPHPERDESSDNLWKVRGLTMGRC